MSWKKRGEILEPEDKTMLTVEFTDPLGNPINVDSTPSIQIIDPIGVPMFANPTSVGIQQLATGKYGYLFEVPINPALGVFSDYWQAFVQGYKVSQNFQFIVNYTQVPQINQDGQIALGDDPGFYYSQEALMNINKCLKLLKARLSSEGKSQSVDNFGNTIFIDCSTFSLDILTTFLDNALAEFNSIPFFTGFTFDDSNAIGQFCSILVERATLEALASKALLERSREYTIDDNGIHFTPPAISELMMTQYSTLLTNYWEKLKFIKASLRPRAIGLGVFGMTSTINPAVKQISHLRERQLV
jgi:hypothetical protein